MISQCLISEDKANGSPELVAILDKLMIVCDPKDYTYWRLVAAFYFGAKVVK